MTATQILSKDWTVREIEELVDQGRLLLIVNTHNLLRKAHTLLIAEAKKKPVQPAIATLEFSYLPHAEELEPFTNKGWRLICVVRSETMMDFAKHDSRFLAYFEIPVEQERAPDVE